MRAKDDEGGEDEDLEECCVCLDSLSSAPVCALLKSRSGTRRSCRHFIHADCAKRIDPARCPLCRTPFFSLSLAMDRESLRLHGSKGIVTVCKNLDAEYVRHVRCSTLVQLLAAIFPIRQSVLETFVLASAGGSSKVGSAEVARVLRRCGWADKLLGEGRVNKDLVADSAYGYGFHILARRSIRSAALRLAGALGTSIFCGILGTSCGIFAGALASVPAKHFVDILYDDVLSEPVVDALALVVLALYYGARRKDLVMRGGLFGSLAGALFGWITALTVVHPESYGLRQVFFSGLYGKTIRNLFMFLRRGGRRHRMGRVDLTRALLGA